MDFAAASCQSDTNLTAGRVFNVAAISSLQTALYRRGMITQIPSMIYLVSLARGDRIATNVGTYSVHHVRPELFGGFEHDPASGPKLALPEKALFDFLYLSPTRGRLFAALPELDLPRGFRRSVARAWADRIPSRRSRTIVLRKLDEVLGRVEMRGSVSRRP